MNKIKTILLKTFVVFVIVIFLCSCNKSSNKMKYFDSSFYELLLNQKIIAIGEVHGTKEVPYLADQIIKYLNDNGKKVILALECTISDQKIFNTAISEKELMKSETFMFKLDGRSSKAMAELILKTKSNKINLIKCFNPPLYGIANERDSLMALKLKMDIESNPDYIFVIISGNYHTLISPYSKLKDDGVFWAKRPMLCILKNMLPDNVPIFSIVHYFQKGAVYVRDSTNNLVLDSAIDHFNYHPIKDKNWFFEILEGNSYPYNAIFYTKTSEASEL